MTATINAESGASLGWSLARFGSTVKISRPGCKGIGTTESLLGKGFQWGRAACGSVSLPVWTALSRSARLLGAGEAALGGGADFLQPIDRMAEAVKTAKRTWLFMPPKYNPFRIKDQVQDFASPQTAGRPSLVRRGARPGIRCPEADTSFRKRTAGRLSRLERTGRSHCG